jgi:hypothetical protein
MSQELTDRSATGHRAHALRAEITLLFV